MNDHGEVVLYAADRGPAVEVRLERETVWLTQAQLAQLFHRDQSVIARHLRNVFAEGELTPDKSNMQKMHIALSDRPVTMYSLDVIISIGYRVKSTRGVQFRQWATRVLREHLVRGYTVNERRLAELKQTIRLAEQVLERHRVTSSEAEGLLRVVADYSRALDLLDDYDHQRVGPTPPAGATTEILGIAYDEAVAMIRQLRKAFGKSTHFGVEKDDSLRSSLAAVFQTVDGRDAYPAFENKAANLLYFLVKNHSFVDGNKRIAAALFLWFLEKNGRLYDTNAGKCLANATLVAVTLMIAESRPAERGIILSILAHLLAVEPAS